MAERKIKMARQQLIEKVLNAIEELYDNPEPGQSAKELAEQIKSIAKENQQDMQLEEFIAILEE